MASRWCRPSPAACLARRRSERSQTYIQNAGLVWLLLLVPLAFIGWFGMNNIVTEEISPRIGSPLAAMTKITGMLMIGFVTSAVGLYLLLPAPMGLGAPDWAK